MNKDALDSSTVSAGTSALAVTAVTSTFAVIADLRERSSNCCVHHDSRDSARSCHSHGALSLVVGVVTAVIAVITGTRDCSDRSELLREWV